MLHSQQYHQWLKEQLYQASSEAKAASIRRYFPAGINCIGAISEDVNRISTTFIQTHHQLRPFEFWELAEFILFHAEYHEEILVAYRLVEKQIKKKQFDETTLVRFRYWLEHYANNWALVDDLCMKAIYQYLLARPHLIEQIGQWADSDISWCRRASNVVWVKFIHRKIGKAIYQLDPALVFKHCDKHLTDPDEFVQKSLGWLLKVLSTHHQQLVLNYLANNKHRMQRSTLRYALEKVPKEDRFLIMDV